MPKLRLPAICRQLQRLSAEHPRAGPDFAGLMDRCRLPPLRGEAPVFARGDISGATIPRTPCKVPADWSTAVTDGRDEAGYRKGGTGACGGDGRTEAHDGPVRLDAGDCCIDHCGRAAREGAGH